METWVWDCAIAAGHGDEPLMCEVGRVENVAEEHEHVMRTGQ
jgi:hypothetical protein